MYKADLLHNYPILIQSLVENKEYKLLYFFIRVLKKIIQMTPKKLCNDCYWSKDYSKRFEICKENCPSKDKNQIKIYFDKPEFKESIIKCQMSKFKSLASLTQSMINPYFLDIFTKKLKCQFVLPHLNFIYVSDDYTYSNIIKLLKE